MRELVGRINRIASSGRRRVREFIGRLKREATAALWPAALAAVVGPLAVAVLPLLRTTVAEFLPPGPERLVVLASGFALGAEVVRCHVCKFRLGRKLAKVEAALSRADNTANEREGQT